MESLYFLVPCALIFIAIAVKVLFWAINNGQYDNLDTEAHRILFDDEKKSSSATTAKNSTEQQASTRQSELLVSPVSTASTELPVSELPAAPESTSGQKSE